MTRIVLVGAGHAHVEVLRRLARRPIPGATVTLVSRVAAAAYSGMLPGVVAGHYRPDALLVLVSPLAARAGAACLRATAVGLDPERRLLRIAGGDTLGYDLVSLDIGSTPDMSGAPPMGDSLLPVKPLETFLPALEAAEARLLRRSGRAARLAVFGGGVAGTEMALALRHRYARRGASVAIVLIERGPEIAPGLPVAARRRLLAACAEHDVEVRTGRDAAPAANVDLAIWTTGAAAPAWLRETGLALDARGFLLVDPSLRSVSSRQVFAAGDVAAMERSPRPKAGVFAVRQGPVLAENIRRAAAGRRLRAYRPQRAWLSLVATGPRHAVAARGGLTAAGRWVWRWKDWNDRRFVARHRVEADGAPPCRETAGAAAASER